MMTRRTSRMAVAVIAGVLALGACGGDDGDDAATDGASGVPEVSADEALAAQVPDAFKEDGELLFATDASYAPNEFFADDGTTIVGFDVDMGKAIAAKLGLEGVFENSSFDSLIVGVQNGKYEISMSSFTINPDRLQQANMISYFSAGTAWAVASGNPEGVDADQACGKTVAVQKATVQVDDIKAKNQECEDGGQPAIDVQQYGLQSEATTAVVSGKADAMLSDSPVIAYAIKQSGQLEQLGDIYDSAPYGIVVAKDQEEFATAVQGAVDALIADGSYDAIAQQWGVQGGEVEAAEVNPEVG
jgi:polar amino acid transport system substrate-binding protein